MKKSVIHGRRLLSRDHRRSVSSSNLCSACWKSTITRRYWQASVSSIVNRRLARARVTSNQRLWNHFVKISCRICFSRSLCSCQRGCWWQLSIADYSAFIDRTTASSYRDGLLSHELLRVFFQFKDLKETVVQYLSLKKI